ncbi:hypothetical protein AGABI1DRAFT_116306 [Agaricus bisporus var. burnettii JB137-S8]|uniref:Uncharacterized protein n=1 Tax=Agaricus bisporus var. burnettii (strain JB137-S8 / ATCC MYA-4627 / FGSC 10392) TaxID=597362 RepID=K5WXS3_AGABU|nr:uncharacterized protein AGABI1DRAFT_116306 [Agaricus bisporus var. burnettii JB137-S8]EKM75588.1 hypothetical protein AGABI1DRAFT_116306 [Agaricus bisporus var. burnettii JB137-S8]
MSSASVQNGLINLFPAPKPFSSVDLPASIPTPGASPESTAALREALQDDYKRWHCFFNEQGFHNHAIHGILALWHLGADADTIKTAYAKSSSYQRPAFASPEPITKNNWTDHLGDEKYYDGYLVFFTGELAAKGPSAILEDYIFSSATNFPEGDKKVQMLNRFMDGLLHPIIHCGQGYELGIPGLIAEGLAQAAVHPGDSGPVVPASWWKGSDNKTHDSTSSPLSVFSRILVDPEITWPEDAGAENMYRAALKKYSSHILKHVNAWKYNEADLPRVLEEIAWAVTLLYAVPGFPKKDTDVYNADFYSMHFVTSSLFLPSIAAHLTPTSQELLLRSYLAAVSGWFIARGKPNLDIQAFFANDKTLKSLFPTAPTHDGPSYTLPDASKASPNPWTEIIQLTILHPDEHVHKLQRTLLQYAQTYGTREAGYFKDVELKGADKLDGSLFIRAANLSALRLNQPPVVANISGGPFDMYWDRRGFFQK